MTREGVKTCAARDVPQATVHIAGGGENHLLGEEARARDVTFMTLKLTYELGWR